VTNIRNFAGSSNNLSNLAEKIPATTVAPSLLSPPQLQTIQALASQLHQAPLDAASQTGAITLFTGTDSAAKLAAAQTLANNLHRNLYRIDLGALISKYVGDTRSALAQLLHSPPANGAILFFDEADALFGKRTNVQDSHDRYANQSTDAPDDSNNLLQLLRQYPGIVILALNSNEACNPALLAVTHATLKFPPNP
jgi:SpoVK/Ycf46/Vps4 family AAA+-type ATPase